MTQQTTMKASEVRDNWSQAVAAVAGVATHPEDDVIVATASAASADYVVTDDKHLRNVGIYGGTRIISTAEFAALLRGQTGNPSP
ncbi:MAG TPA: hypothetical protein VJQ45_12220 [Ktedonobacterales bacterium]|nr:hypothetical protein [Ktedonobacterales bacterium]